MIFRRRRACAPGATATTTPTLVGSPGAFTTGAINSAVTPAWDAGAARTAGNLLLCLVIGYGNGTAAGIPTGWSKADGSGNSSTSTTILYKVATGGDAAPTVPADGGGNAWTAQLLEFTATAAASPLDAHATANNSFGPTTLTATAAGADASAGNLIIAMGSCKYLGATTKTTSHTLNNGATETVLENNDATSTTDHYRLGYGVTTGNGAADSDAFALPTGYQGGSVTMASFKHA